MGERPIFPHRLSSYSIDCNSFPGLKRTAFPGGMLTSAPVRGLRPMPVLRGRTLNTPKPRSSMRSPFDSAFFMLSKTVSTAISALVLVIPVLFTTSLMMSSLITNRSADGFLLLAQLKADARGVAAQSQREEDKRKDRRAPSRGFLVRVKRNSIPKQKPEGGRRSRYFNGLCVSFWSGDPTPRNSVGRQSDAGDSGDR